MSDLHTVQSGQSVSISLDDQLPNVTNDTTFDYDALDPETAAYVRSRTATMRARGQRLCADLVGMGNDLLDVKASLPHGQFGAWLETEFGWSERTARNYMALAETFGRLDSATLAGAEPTALYLLASPSTPDDVRDDFIAKAEHGEPITVRDVRDALSDAVPSRRPDPLRQLVGLAYRAYSDRYGRTMLGLGAAGNPRAFRRQIESYPDDERPAVARALAAFGAACVEAAKPYGVESST